jgi:hypothetical protein
MITIIIIIVITIITNYLHDIFHRPRAEVLHKSARKWLIYKRAYMWILLKSLQSPDVDYRWTGLESAREEYVCL